MTRARSTSLLAALLLCLAGVTGARCGGSAPPTLVITSPADGTFTTAPTIEVTGKVKNLGPQSIAFVVVNDDVVAASGNTWSATVTLDPAAIVNGIFVGVQLSSGAVLRERITVVAGDAIADGDFSPMGIAMRLNDSGLDSLEGQISGLVNLDPATLLPVGTEVVSHECAIPGPFGTCLGYVDVKIASPAPSINGFGINIDAVGNDNVAGNIAISQLRVDLDIVGAVDCGLRIRSTSTNILGSYGLQPNVDPTEVDVFQNGNVDVNFSGFSQEYTSGICDFPLIGDIIALIIGSVEGDVEMGFESFLNTTDGMGNTPVAGAIEEALAGIEIAGPIGEAIGVSLEAPLFDVYEDSVGITLDSDARITATLPDPNAVDLLASYHVDEAFPIFGATTPVGGLPYGLALSISTSAFNQLLKAEIESGLLLTTIEDQDLAGTPVDLILKPTVAPVVSGHTGPNGELADLRVGGLRIEMRRSTDNQLVLELAVDATVGLDVGLAAGELSFQLGTLDAANLDIDIIRNPFNFNEGGLQTLLLIALPDVFPDLAGSLGTFPLPTFLGLEPSLVEVGRSGEFMTLYLNLLPAP
jgi:hypothetical protein